MSEDTRTLQAVRHDIRDALKDYPGVYSPLQGRPGVRFDENINNFNAVRESLGSLEEVAAKASDDHAARLQARIEAAQAEVTRLQEKLARVPANAEERAAKAAEAVAAVTPLIDEAAAIIDARDEEEYFAAKEAAKPSYDYEDDAEEDWDDEED